MTAPREEDPYYQELQDAAVTPLWRVPTATEPLVHERAHLWRWAELYPLLMRSADKVRLGAEEGDRRVLTFKNPGLVVGFGGTQTLACALQLLLPGETAPAHRHTFHALRFVVQGTGAFTVVEGAKIRMRAGDLLLTPGWTWHDHGHDGAEPMVWLDCLDTPFAVTMRALFYQDFPERQNQPILSEEPPTSMVYPWERAYGALRRLQEEQARAGGPDPEDGALVEYLNPTTGGPVLPTISCALQGLPPGFHTRARRETASTLCHVVRGSGRSVVDGRELRWERGDTFALPAWRWAEHEAGDGEDGEVVLFRMTDRPMVEPFAYYRRESMQEGEGFQQVTGRAPATVSAGAR